MSKNDPIFLVASIFLVAGSGISICAENIWLGSVCIAIADLYLLAILAFAAYRSDVGTDETPRLIKNFFPSSLVGCVVVISLLVTLILGFASVYMTFNTGEHLTTTFKSSLDAIYFSYVTITTLGYGDFTPASNTTKYIVLLQLSSGLTLLLGAFPLLIARISNYLPEPDPKG
jgi:hypothetical protein